MDAGLIVFLVIMALVVFFCFFMAVKMSKAKKKAKRARKQLVESTGALADIVLPHTAGLPVPEGVFCNLFLLPDKLQVHASGTQFDLDLTRITDVVEKTDVEIQKQMVSSAGGAVAGGLLLGPVGALIGGRAKTKTSREIKSYMIISYSKGDALEYMAFNTTGNFKVLKFISAVKAAIPAQSTIIAL